MAAKPEQRYMGGQAVLEGVMMRGVTTWAVAVRTPEGDVEVVTHDVPGWSERYRAVPLLRGVMGLGESLSLGYKALTWSANRQVPEDEQVSEKAMGWTMGIAMVIFSGLFLVLPAIAGRGLRNVIDFLPFQASEGVLRILIFIGYILLISRMRDIRRVFEYHGAEHKAIAAYENGVELTPHSAQRFSTAHVRCGTNFLLTVMVIAILTYSVVPSPNLLVIVSSRVVLIPVIAGLSYEVIRVSARNMHKAWVRAVMRPGLLLQRLTTREPDLDQLEVAIASLRAVMSEEQLAEVDTRAA
ncbi:MAG: DUF1385 domain-containing protein [Acidimicrobiia bacterium]|nr:DUF1385 domain-containing protein [Acidimicrobiia bacterium]